MNNAINTVVKTLTSSQGAKVKHTQLQSEVEKVSIDDMEIMDLVSNVTKSVLNGDNAINTISTSIEQFNHNAIVLHNGGVRLQDGRSKDKATSVIRSQFLEEIKTLRTRTAQNYYQLFMKVVNSGKPIKSFNTDSNKGNTESNKGNTESNKGKTKKGANTEPKSIDVILANLVNHPAFSKTLSKESQNEIKALLVEFDYDVSL